MDQFDLPGLLRGGGDPLEKPFLIGMGRIAAQDMHSCIDGTSLPFHEDMLPGFIRSFHDLAPQGALRLVPHEENIRLGIFQSASQMIQDASSAAHAASRDDDGRSVHFQNLEMVLVGTDRVELFEIKGMIPLAEPLSRFLIPVGSQFTVNFGHGQPQGRIEKHGDL
jgi:hypothetical protein